MFELEVILATPEVQHRRKVQLREGGTAAEAVALSGLLVEGQGALHPLARFGRLIAPETLLAEGDRVEILRPLIADPRDARRDRVSAVRKQRARARQAGG